jgi:hypothetical protein
MLVKKRCDICDKEVSLGNWSKHIITTKHKNLLKIQEQRLVYCRICDVRVDRDTWTDHLKSSSHKRNANVFRSKLPKPSNKRKCMKYDFVTDDYIVAKSEEALEGCFLTLRVTPRHDIVSVSVLIEELPELLREKLNDRLREKSGLKIQIVIRGLFRKFIPATGKEEFEELTIASNNKIALRKEDLDEVVIELLTQISNKIEGFDNNEAYWHLVRIIHVDFKLREYKPLSGSNYIELPGWISAKKATINIKNDDQKCFKYCMSYHKHKHEIKKDPQRLYHYKQWNNDYNYEGIAFPVSADDINKFCKQNNVSVNVYIINKEEILPYQTTARDEKKDDHINLLLIEKDNEAHYVYIKNLSRLIRDQLTKYEHHHFICERCFTHTNNENVFTRHVSLCDNFNKFEKAIPILPESDNNILKFKNFHKTIIAPLVYYADLEAVLRKIDNGKLKTKHEACAYSFLALSDFYKNFVLYTGSSAKDTMNHFIQALKEEANKINSIFNERLTTFKTPHLTLEQQRKFNNSTECHFCKKELNNDKVRDHCHITGKFRGAAHQACNLKVRTSLKIPVFFHNGSGYDFKHFIRKLYKLDRNLRVLPQTEEKYFSITVKVEGTNIQFEFKDSLKFLLKSIDSVSKVLYKKNGTASFPLLRDHFNDVSPDILELLVQKGVFPYSYIDSFEKLNETTFPPLEAFYDDLKDQALERKDYERGLKVWETFRCKSVREYMELYLTCDVLLLAECFEEFRNTSFQTYGLDPSHYVSSPGLSWDAMLKLTKEELELITDPDMLLMVMEGIRGGLSCIMLRYAEANNKYMITYDPSKNSIYIVSVDANNLYGFAMSFKLPYRGFKWCTPDEIRRLEENLMDIPDDSNTGYIIKVKHLEYLKELHDYHNDYPFFPIHKDIEYEELSPYQKNLKLKCPPSRKLVASLEDKRGLICDYRTLKQSIQNGLKLHGIECAIKFEQKAWLKPYIELNTQLRQQATSDFEKDFFKLMNNSVYGKTIENVLNRQDIEFCCERKQALKYLKKINFKRETIFTKHLVALHMNRMQVLFNKPIYAGFCVLEMSKWGMFKFVYEYIKPKWGDRVTIMETDTDNLNLRIETADFYEDIKTDIAQWFDTSNFPENNRFGIQPMNKMKLGCFKIETGEHIIIKMVGLRSKMHCQAIEHSDFTELKRREKGVPHHITNTHQFQLWKKVLDNEINSTATYNMIKSEKLNVYTIKQTKVALSNFDDKRHILDDGYTTLAHGHYRISSHDNT